MATAEELQSQLEEAMQTAEMYAEQLAEKDDEIAELRERNGQLEEELVGEGRGGDLEMRDELRDLRSRLEQAEDQLEKAMDAAKEQESRARDLDLQNRALKMEKLKLEAEIQKEQERAEVLEESVHTMRQRTEQAAESEGRIGAREKNHKKTLIKALSENEELRKEVADLEQVVQTLYQAVNEKDASLKESHNELEATAQELKDMENEVEELKRLIAEKDSQIASAQEEINAVGEMEVEIEERVKAKVDKWKGRIKDLEKELDEERQKQGALQKKCDSLLLESGLREVEQQLVASEERNKAVRKDLEETRSLLEEAHSEMLQLARENENMRTDQGKFIEVALENERAEIERLRNVIVSKENLLEEERKRYSELYEEKGALEEELQDREFTLAEYERGHGLTEAVLKQKKLKGDVRRRDKEIRRLNQSLSERISAHEKLYETCRRLKKRAGLPDEFQFDDLELEEGLRGQTERLQSLIKELESQNEALETERLRLLEALRKNAQNMGDKGMKFYGLSAEQVLLVNQFAENLRDGRTDLPLNDKSLQLLEEVRQLKMQLRDTERDLAAAELQLEQGDYPNDAQESKISPKTTLPLSPHGLSPRHMEKQMERFAQEQASMVSELKLELQKALSNVVGIHRQGTSSPHIHSPTSQTALSPKNDPRYERLMEMLTTKLEGGESNAALDREQVEIMRNELERQSAMNEQLIKRLQDAEGLAEKLSVQHYAQPQLIGLRHRTSSGEQRSAPSAPPVEVIALQKPTSAVAHRFNESQLSNLRLPPEEWTESYILVNNRLTICIEKLVLKEKQVTHLESRLQEYEEKMEVHAGQMALLYREFLESQKRWNQDTQSLKSEVDNARSERDAYRIKARRLDTLCAVLEGDDDGVRNQVKELTRKVAVLEVNEVILARKYNLLAEEEKSARNAKEIVQHEMVQAETALRERVLYLEEWKAGAQSELVHLSKQLEKCISRDVHDQVVHSLASLRHKYRDLIRKEAQLRGRTSGAQALRRRVSEVEAELELLRSENVQAKQEAGALKEQIGMLKQHAQSPKHESSATGDDLRSLTRTEDLLEQCAKLKGEVVEKQIVLEGALKKAEIYEKRATELSNELREESLRADEAENNLESSRHVSNRLEEELVQVRDLFQGGANKEERKVLEERVLELERLYENLARENNRYRELAEIASKQVQAFEMYTQAKEKEIESFKSQLREINSRSDDDAIIGKIQHELTTTKVSYQMFVRKFEMAKVALKRNELEIQKLEMSVDEKDRVIRQTREEARARILSLEIALEKLGFVGTNGGNHSVAGENQSEFVLSGMERLSETVSKLGEAAERSEEALRRSETSRRNLELELEKKQVEVESVQSLITDLKNRIFRNQEDMEVDTSNELDSASKHRNLARRLLDISEELKSSKLESTRQRRELELLREEKHHLEKLREKDEEHMQRLEESLAQVENAMRRRDDERTLRSASDRNARDGFGLPLLAFRQPQSIHGKPSRPEQSAEKSGSLSETAAVENQESERAAIIQHSELVAELQSQIQDADRREEQFEREVERVKNKMRYYQKKLRTEGIEVDSEDEDVFQNQKKESSEIGHSNNQREEPSGGNQRQSGKYYEADARKLQAAAQQTIASLKDMVNRKNQIIDGLKQKIELSRKSFMAEREKDQAEIERLTEKLYEDNKEAIGKLRDAYEDIAKGSLPSDANGGGTGDPDHVFHRELLERLEEADVILERKDRRILELERVIEELQLLRQKAEDRAAKSAEIAESLRGKVKQIMISKETNSSDALVKQLRGQLISKEKKLLGLRSAVVALKNEFVKAEEDHEEELIKKDREISHLLSQTRSSKSHSAKDDEDDADDTSSLKSLKRQLESLKNRVERSKEDLDLAKKTEEKLRVENVKLRNELSEKADLGDDKSEEASRAILDLKKYKRQVDELRRENLRLKEALENGEARSVRDRPGGSQRDRSGKREEKESDQITALKQSQVENKDKALKAEIAQLEQKLKIVQAQNAALRSAARGPASTGEAASSSDRKENNSPALEKWESDKKLETRVQILTKKLEERGKLLEAAKAQAQQASSLLEKTVKDRSSMQGRLAKMAANELGERDSSREWKKIVADLKEECTSKDARIADLQRLADVEQRSEINRLKREISHAQSKIQELEDAAEMIQMRRKSSGVDSLQFAEEQFVREDELRQQLSMMRADIRDMESELLEKDNTILELRFELEREGDKAVKLERSLKSLKPSDREGESKAPDKGMLSAKRGPGERFKRERDLESVVESLQKIVQKVQAENERLKRSAGNSSKRTELSKQLKAVRQEKEELELSNQALTRRLQQVQDAPSKLVRVEDAVKTLKRQLRERDAKGEENKRIIELLREENESLKEQADQSTFRFERGEPSGRSTTERQLRAQISEQDRLIHDLQTRGSNGEDSLTLRAENKALKTENQRLLNELNAFDLDFFEEIEDLKYKYQQAVADNRELRRQLEA